MSTSIFDLTAITTPATGDILPIVDVSDTTDSSDGTTRKITAANLATIVNDRTHLHAGSTPFSVEYGIVPWSHCTLSTTSIALNTLYAFPFIAHRTGTLDQIAFHSDGTAGGEYGIALYTPTSASNIYPSALVEDLGNVACTTTSVKTLAVSRAVTAGQFYWLVFWGNKNLSVRSLASNAGFLNVLGYDLESNTQYTFLSLGSQTYTSTFPDPFTAGATRSNSNFPLVMVRYSA